MAMEKDTDERPSGSNPGAVEATVLAELPNKTYRLELANRAQVIGHPAGAAKVNFVRLRERDRVLVELAPHDPTRGRIVKLLQK